LLPTRPPSRLALNRLAAAQPTAGRPSLRTSTRRPARSPSRACASGRRWTCTRSGAARCSATCRSCPPARPPAGARVTTRAASVVHHGSGACGHTRGCRVWGAGSPRSRRLLVAYQRHAGGRPARAVSYLKIMFKALCSVLRLPTDCYHSYTDYVKRAGGRRAQKGEWFGEASLVARNAADLNWRYDRSVTAVTDSDLCYLRKADVRGPAPARPARPCQGGCHRVADKRGERRSPLGGGAQRCGGRRC
jgi:hypothetical protein